ncbi:MAG: hypothetical protein IJA03_00355, partial [Bacteroidaceae bacterium]|nr:hypothetical protein [Bacteroidaceae bacterium]
QQQFVADYLQHLQLSATLIFLSYFSLDTSNILTQNVGFPNFLFLLSEGIERKNKRSRWKCLFTRVKRSLHLGKEISSLR